MTHEGTHEGLCRLLEWDSEFFGCRIARIDSSRLDAAKMERVGEFARKEAIDCFYFLVDGKDVESIRAAEAAGFQCTDVRVTRERSLVGISNDVPHDIEAFREDDLPALQAIARCSHGATRFYHDPHFSRERCDALYERWISNSCAGEVERVLVVRRAGRAVGYLTCEIDSSTTGRIGLVAVAESERGRQFGESLVRGSLSWFADRGREQVRVISQARNLASAKLYQRLGFQTVAVEHWYHLWPNPEQSA